MITNNTPNMHYAVERWQPLNCRSAGMNPTEAFLDSKFEIASCFQRRVFNDVVVAACSRRCRPSVGVSTNFGLAPNGSTEAWIVGGCGRCKTTTVARRGDVLSLQIGSAINVEILSSLRDFPHVWGPQVRVGTRSYMLSSFPDFQNRRSVQPPMC